LAKLCRLRASAWIWVSALYASVRLLLTLAALAYLSRALRAKAIA